jgi:hypothetical protein
MSGTLKLNFLNLRHSCFGNKSVWEGDSGLLGKLMTTQIEYEKMATADFVIGLEKLKRVIEGQKYETKTAPAQKHRVIGQISKSHYIGISGTLEELGNR